jgi:hypothetical protein
MERDPFSAPLDMQMSLGHSLVVGRSLKERNPASHHTVVSGDLNQDDRRGSGMTQPENLSCGMDAGRGQNAGLHVHAFRMTLAPHPAKAGVPLRTAQTAMRHSDPKLTAYICTDPALLDVGAALDALPHIPWTAHRRMKPTRKPKGRRVPRKMAPKRGHQLPPKRGILCSNVTEKPRR